MSRVTNVDQHKFAAETEHAIARHARSRRHALCMHGAYRQECAHVMQWCCVDMSIKIFIFRTFSRGSQAICSISSIIIDIRTAKKLCCKSDLIKIIEHVKSNPESGFCDLETTS
jgi:hypothetical protein